MARAAAIKNYFTFVKGLITEANPLTYPESASLDEDNMDLKANGSRVRRLAIDYELGYQKRAVAATDANAQVWAHDAFPWRGVAGIATKNHVIYQDGRYLYVHDIDVNVVSLAPIHTVDLNTFKADAALAADRVGDQPVDITYGNGVAYVVSSAINPFYIEYNSTTATYANNVITQDIRDFEGEDDGLATDTRPAYASLAALKAGNPKHYYNLRNQGWTDAHITTYITAGGVAPSNSDIWVYGKDAADVFQAALMNLQWFGSTRAPNGHYSWNPYNTVRTGVVAGATDFVTLARPSTCAYYAGRLWTAGIADSKLAGTVLYTRVVQNKTLDVGKCRMEADPTSEVISDLQPDDGGTISIPESGIIHRVVPVSNGIAIVAQNGVWLVRGGADSGFTADLFSVQKVTTVGCDAPKSVVEVEGTLMYMSRSGIYVLSPDQSGLSLVAQNITQTTIQSEFETIPFAKLQLCKGVYDPLEREIKFYYTLDTTSVYKYRYDRILTLDMRLSAFYKSSISGVSGTNPHVTAVFPTLNIHATGVYGSSIRHFTAVLTGAAWDYSVSVFHSNTFMDWYTEDTTGVDYTSFVETGYQLFDDALRNKDIDWLTVFMERTELTATDGTPNNQSSCIMQTKFDWTDNANSQKWTAPLEIYVYQLPFLLTFSPTTPGTEDYLYGYSVITKKEKVRGTGRAIRIRFTSSTGKDMRILGWVIATSGVTTP